MTKRKRALRSNTPQAPEAATELAQLQAEVAQLQAELQEARAHSAQQEATIQRLQLRLQALEPPRPGDAVSTPPQSTSADGSATAQSRVRDIFVQELLRSQQADSPSAGPANS
jgi:capsule polysaccharide export protein KpsE/RkpR